MTKEEWLKFGASLVERKSELFGWRDSINILRDKERDPLDIYDVVFYGNHKDGISASTGSLSAADSSAFSSSMRESALRRWDRLIEIQFSFVEEQIAEVEREIENL